MKLKHLSLFNGIGGFQLAAHWMGWENVASVEIDDFCNKVTKKHFPNCIQYKDIKEFDGLIYRDKIDIITGGFPCQPFSTAGKRMGSADPRHLWPENYRVIKEVKPKIILGENVYGIVNWNDGMVFEMVCADLESEGYEVQSVILPACGKEANSIRYRVWFIAMLADAYKNGCERGDSGYEEQPNKRGFDALNDASKVLISDTTHIKQIGSQELELQRREAIREMRRGIIEARKAHWLSWTVEPTICGDDDGIPNRVDRIAALGNAIDPHIAYEIFKAIESTILTPQI